MITGYRHEVSDDYHTLSCCHVTVLVWGAISCVIVVISHPNEPYRQEQCGRFEEHPVSRSRTRMKDAVDATLQNSLPHLSTLRGYEAL